MTITTSDFILELKSKGIHLRLEGENLRLSAPREAINDKVRAEIRAHKGAIIRLLSRLEDPTAGDKPPIPRASRQQPLPLSFAQQRLFFMQKFAPEDPAYNLPSAFRFSGDLDVAILETTLWELEERHEILRTTFVEREDDDEPVQHIHPPARNPIIRLDLTTEPPEKREDAARTFAIEHFSQTFDLAQSPLYRVWLLQMGKDDYILLMSMHHIISDAWSMNLMMQELVTLYHKLKNGESTGMSAPDQRQYADFSVWQRKHLSGEIFEKQCAYWQKQLADAPPVLAMPTDFPRPPMLSSEGGTFLFDLPPSLTGAFRRFLQEQQATLSMGVQAVFALLLARYTGQQDICVGHTIANRNHPDLETLLGFFVNTLVLRTSLKDEPGFAELLARVKQASLDAHQHQDVPFERVVEILAPPRTNSYTPIFQVMCDLQNARVHYPAMDNLKLEPVEWGTDAAKFDISFDVEENDGALCGLIQYRTALFRPETIEIMADSFKHLMEGILAAPDTNVWELPLPAYEDRDHVLPDRWMLNAPAPEPEAPSLESPVHVAPKNPREKELAGMFQEILNLADVGVHDNFFELGGHSLLAARLLSRIRRHFGYDISLPSFFDHPTVAQLATYVEVMDWSRETVPDQEETEEFEMGFL